MNSYNSHLLRYVVRNKKYQKRKVLLRPSYSVRRFWHHVSTRKKLTVSGLENIPRTGGFLIVAKHTSSSDPYDIIEALPKSILVHWISHKDRLRVKTRAAELFGYPDVCTKVKKYLPILAKPICHILAIQSVYGDRSLYPIVVDREGVDKKTNTSAVLLARAVLKSGGVVGIFPERTTRQVGKYNVNETKFTSIATFAGVPILPINLKRDVKEIVIGRPIYPDELARMGDNIEVKIMDLIKEL